MANDDIRATPRLKAPAGACDTHMHFYDARYPTATTATMTPPDASVAEYRAVQRRLGLSRTVIVQPTTYGTDNRCTLEGIAGLGLDSARGIATVDDSVGERELEDLTSRGMRGARFHMLRGGAILWDQLDRIAARVQGVGWHVQLQLDGRELPEREAQIRGWPGTIVIDHIGKFLEPVPRDHPAFRCLVGLVESGRVWVKLSAMYEVSKVGPPLYDDIARTSLCSSTRSSPGRRTTRHDGESSSTTRPSFTGSDEGTSSRMRASRSGIFRGARATKDPG